MTLKVVIWMNISTKSVIIAICSIIVTLSSCKPSDNSIYYYNVNDDVLPPEIKISVPLANDLYSLTDDVHIVGTVKDLETATTGGMLSTLNVRVDQIDPANSNAVVKTLLNKNPNVQGKEGYTINEKFVVNFAPSTVYCRLLVTAYDPTGRFDIDSVYFSIQ